MPTITNAKAIQKKSKSHTITPTGPDTYTVTSGASGSEYQVRVTDNGGYCSCEWAKYRPQADGRSGCSHVTAVYNFIAAESNRTVSVWASVDDAKRQRKPALNIGDGVTLTARLKPAPILWVIQAQTQDTIRILETV
jgi:predicted nucleic acid-binding Zn finger protein